MFIFNPHINCRLLIDKTYW